MGGIERVARGVIGDLEAKLPRQRKTQRGKLGLLVASMLEVRSANLMDLAASLPRPCAGIAKRYQWIERFLGNPLVDVDAVMAPYGREVLARLARRGARVVVMIDQSKASDRHQMVMVSARVGGRALPLAWRVKQTQGAIGFAEQREALQAVQAMLPEGLTPVLMGDRFYGSPDLIAWCQTQGWDWRLRLKQDLLVFEDGGETTLAECFARGAHRLTGVKLTHKRVPSHVAMIHEPRSSRALDHRDVRDADIPSRSRLRAALGHRGHVLRLQNKGLRAGKQQDPIPRSAVETDPGHGARPSLGRLHRHVGCRAQPDPRRKKAPQDRPRKAWRSLTSFFKRGIRSLQAIFQTGTDVPPLWAAWRN
jgi:hypothetical protein